jgi:hypothetical protein
MANFYCEYCGSRYQNVQSLTGGSCPKHPSGPSKGKHSLYQGSEKSKYTCKYCGSQYSSIQAMTAGSCPRHPLGASKGRHTPAL